MPATVNFTEVDNALSMAEKREAGSRDHAIVRSSMWSSMIWIFAGGEGASQGRPGWFCSFFDLPAPLQPPVAQSPQSAILLPAMGFWLWRYGECATVFVFAIRRNHRLAMALCRSGGMAFGMCIHPD